MPADTVTPEMAAEPHDMSESHEPQAMQPSDASTAEPIEDVRDEQVCADLPLTARVEALLLSTDKPLPEARLAKLVGIEGKGSAKAIDEAVEQLNQQYEETGRSFRIQRVAGGLQVLTLPEYGPLLARLHIDRQQTRLSPAALETLSIIAYRQPIMRAEIEAIRGVASGEVLRGLLERRLVKITGRAEELGRPMLYGTTREFLNVFGLSSIEDLPMVEGLQREPSYQPTPPESDQETTTEQSEAAEAGEADAASTDEDAEDSNNDD